jgi:ATP-dependent DNA helicase RecG
VAADRGADLKAAGARPPRGAVAERPGAVAERPAADETSGGEGTPPGRSRSALQSRLEKLGILRDADLVLHLPLRYEDQTRLVPLADLVPGATCQVEGEVEAADVQFRPRRQLVCLLEQGGARLVLRFFHFYPNQQRMLARGKCVRAFGEVRAGYHGLEMVHPTFRVVEAGAPLPERLTPVYPTTAGLSQEALRKLIRRAIGGHPELLAESLPEWLRARRRLWGFADAVATLHEPPPEASQEALDARTHPAWTRLKFDELLAQQLALRRMRRQRARAGAPVLAGDGTLSRALLAGVPFPLTAAQERVRREIAADLARATPMQRLLQGDVGSGKTIVALLAALQCIESGWQAAFMAPTEILAEQHYRKLEAWLARLPVKVAWLTGSLPAKARRAALEAAASGAAQLVVGTHALFQDEVRLARLGLAIVDEQHRFGVAQRLALRGKALAAGPGREAHTLMMSATPIPRTLAMSFYADLDVSVIDELPPGRTPVATRLVNQRRRAEVVDRVRRVCAEGRQVYWVCPLIEESEKLQLQTALATFEELTAALPGLRVGLLHGRMKPDEKTAVMDALAKGEVHVLVATTVVEVGVDVPNATLMVIEHAERFGLAQLHQLRGRVGRGADESTCVLLFEEPMSDTAKARLKVVYESTDGFEIARQDLAIRGPGEFLGARQSGVPLLRFADLERDAALIEVARDAADELLRRDPRAAESLVERWFGGRKDFVKA